MTENSNFTSVYVIATYNALICSNYIWFPAWLEDCSSAIKYERSVLSVGQEVLYVLPVSSILGKLPVVPGTLSANGSDLTSLNASNITSRT